MNKEIASCIVCSNKNPVLVSSGHNKPENKGKKYFSCANCSTFQWVGVDGPYLPEGSKPALSAQPATQTTIPQDNPKSAEEFQQSLVEKPAARERVEQPAEPTTDWNERSRRIERQHSQEMAMTYLELKGITEFTKEDLIKTINWFARDIDRTVNDPIPVKEKPVKNVEDEAGLEQPLKHPFIKGLEEDQQKDQQLENLDINTPDGLEEVDESGMPF